MIDGGSEELAAGIEDDSGFGDGQHEFQMLV